MCPAQPRVARGLGWAGVPLPALLLLGEHGPAAPRRRQRAHVSVVRDDEADLLACVAGAGAGAGAAHTGASDHGAAVAAHGHRPQSRVRQRLRAVSHLPSRVRGEEGEHPLSHSPGHELEPAGYAVRFACGRRVFSSGIVTGYACGVWPGSALGAAQPRTLLPVGLGPDALLVVAHQAPVPQLAPCTTRTVAGSRA